ncbi:MAG: phosphopentomutase [Ruminococcaceae bacterium]|nr:phosphopentomutase [Oscillospiraceae bacterium]
MKKRIFLIVLDSFGVGELPDAADFGDVGSNTLGALQATGKLDCPNLEKLGLFNIENCARGKYAPVSAPLADFGRMSEASRGKDTTTGHWEIAGLISKKPLPTYPEGFPEDVVAEFEKRAGVGILCNKPYSGTEVIKDYGEEHLKTGKLIVYTSADSVFQIAAHESIVSLKELYHYCEIAREMLVGEHGVGRVIARPFGGEYPFKRLAGRHDYSLLPPADTMLDILKARGYATISVGKINDIFASRGVSESTPTANNTEGMDVTLEIADRDFCGLCFVNLVDFDMVYGHRNDIEGYTNAINEFDRRLGELLAKIEDDDMLIITADHGCDPSTPSTDHSREYVPLLILDGADYNAGKACGKDLGTIPLFTYVSERVLDNFK